MTQGELLEEKLPSCTVSLSMKVHLGNYESAEAFVSLSGITVETTAEDIEALLDGKAKIAYDALRLRLADRVRSIRAGEVK